MEKGEQLRKLVSGGSEELFGSLCRFYSFGFHCLAKVIRNNFNLELPNY